MYGAAPEMASPLLADESAPLVVREERKGLEELPFVAAAQQARARTDNNILAW